MNMQARWYQAEAKQAVFNYYGAGYKGDTVIALPTGTGKAFCIADLIHSIMHRAPGQRIAMSTRSAKLVAQNAKTLNNVWPFCPLGINSDKLKQRDTEHDIIFGTIQSLYNMARALGWRDVFIIDEAHDISPNDDTLYRGLISILRETNPRMIVIGYTATPFRPKQGMLTEGDNRLFDEIIYNKTGIDDFNQFIDEGYLARLVPRPMNTHLDMSDVRVNKGEYNLSQAEAKALNPDVLYPAIEEMLLWGQDRHCWLIFAQGVKHADVLADLLTQRGVSAAAVHSKYKDAHNFAAIEAFETARVRALVNFGSLTTGFDHAPIDLIAVLRGTRSPNLWVQILGRGTRPYNCFDPQQYKPGFNYQKHNCLVLDFARNTAELGPINDPKIPSPKSKTPGDAPIKLCETEKLVNPYAIGCGSYNHPTAKFCCGCGEMFKFEAKGTAESSTLEVVRSSSPIMSDFMVDNIVFGKHTGRKSGTKSLSVTYYCGMQMFTEYVPIESSSRGGQYIAKEFWKKRSDTPPPDTVDEAYERVTDLRQVKRILVHMNAENGPKINKVSFT